MRFIKGIAALAAALAVLSPVRAQEGPVVTQPSQNATSPITAPAVDVTLPFTHLGTFTLPFVDDKGVEDSALVVMTAVRDARSEAASFTVDTKYFRVVDGKLVEFDRETVSEAVLAATTPALERLEGVASRPEAGGFVYIPHSTYRYRYTPSAVSTRRSYIRSATTWFQAYRSSHTTPPASVRSTPETRPSSDLTPPPADLPPTYQGGDVQVKGYYRKDGTYVRPHTRSSPRR